MAKIFEKLIFGAPDISHYIGEGKWESGPQFPLVLLWERMKPLSSLKTTKRT
jgi:hypothetical protein